MALLEVTDLRAHFGKGEGRVRAVDGVSFEVAEGETLGLVGESGSGKSVTALSLLRLLPPRLSTTEGTVHFDGQDILSLSRRAMRRLRGRSLAMIFQDPMTSLNPVMTVGRQIGEMLTLHEGLNRAQARQRAVELLDMVGIPGAAERIGQYPSQFSGGMRQRVMIAMALSCKPRLVLADEVTTALDVTIQAQILELLKQLSRDLGMATILITHDLGVVASMAHRVHVMYAGRIVEKATTAELFANPRMPYTWGLLRSLPRLDAATRGRRLVPIEGMPPDLTAPRTGCPFQPRCRYRREICSTHEPQLLEIPGAEPGHEANCWGTQQVSGGGWLTDVDWRAEPTEMVGEAA